MSELFIWSGLLSEKRQAIIDFRTQAIKDAGNMYAGFDSKDNVALHAILYEDYGPLSYGRAYEDSVKAGVFYLDKLVPKK